MTAARNQSAGAWIVLIFKILGMILAMGGLCLLTMTLLADAKPRKFLLVSCLAIAAAAILFFLLTAIESKIKGGALFLYLIISPYTYTILAMAMFARILLKKAKKPVVCRTVAVVAAVAAAITAPVLAGALGGSVFAMFAYILFGITMICLAFVVEPLVFTEYINMAKHIFLSLITCGVWTAIWIYHVTKNLNAVSGVEERTPRNELLLCMFLLFFFPYWVFKTAENVEAYGLEKGKSFKLDVLALVFAFLCPLFATVMIQNKINVIVGKPQ